MPYIITVKRRVDAPDLYRPEEVPERIALSTMSRRAVATLGEARKRCHDAVLNSELPNHAAMDPAHDLFYDAALALPEQGGPLGPLPDGTVIEVEEVEWTELIGPYGPGNEWPHPDDDHTQKRICDDWNTAQGVVESA